MNVVRKDQPDLLTNAPVGRLERYCAYDETRRIQFFQITPQITQYK